MARVWYGRRGYFNINPGAPGGDVFQLFQSFDSPTFHDGDSLLRVLLGWQAQTDLTDFGGIPDRGVWPMFVTLNFEPDPGGDAPIGTPPIGGDALWREGVSWSRRHFTDGAVNSYCWEAYSGQPRSGQGQRKAVDKSVSQLIGTVSFDNSAADSFPADTVYVPLNVHGYLWYEFLMEQ